MASNFFKSILPLTVFAVLNFATPQAQAQSNELRNELYVTSLGTDEVLRYDADTGDFLGTFISSGGELDAPDGFIFGPDGNAYVSGFYSDNIVKYDGRTGEYLSTFASSVDGAAQLLFDRDGNLLVNSYGDEQTACNAPNSCSVLKYNGETGDFLGVFASGNGLDGPDGLVIGPDSDLYVSSFLSDEVLEYDGETGAFLGTFASGVRQPTDLAFVAVPEPSSVLGILAFGALGGVTLLKRKQRTKNPG